MMNDLHDSQGWTTRERIIEAAADLFEEFGFGEAGLDQILKSSGVSKTTFYKYFESVEALQRATIQRRGDQWLEATESAARDTGGGDPVRMLQALAHATSEWIRTPTFSGCYFIRACSEFPISTDPRHLAALDVHRRFEKLVVGLAKDAGVLDPEAFAVDLNLALSGAIVCEAMGRPGTTPASLERVCRFLLREHGLAETLAPRE